MGAEASFLCCVVMEYVKCCDAQRSKCPPALSMLLLSLLDRLRRLHELPAWAPVLSHPPDKHVALE
eukprot:4839657-Pyramimonas_sp.AAC.1